MTVLLFGLGWFAVSLVVQVAFVRWRNPSNHALVIARVFVFFALIACGLFVWLAPSGETWTALLCDTGRLAMFAVALTLAYIALYAAVEDDSPSMAMVKFASQAGEAGRGKDDFRIILDEDLLFGERVAAMKRDGWLVETDGGGCMLTPRGRLIGSLYLHMQRWLRMDEGG